MFGLRDGVHLWAASLQREAADTHNPTPLTPTPLSPGMGDHPEDLRHTNHTVLPEALGAAIQISRILLASSTFANHLRDKSEALRCKSL